jgi:hypothetical protein
MEARRAGRPHDLDVHRDRSLFVKALAGEPPRQGTPAADEIAAKTSSLQWRN